MLDSCLLVARKQFFAPATHENSTTKLNAE
jgi:hypothetical protein